MDIEIRVRVKCYGRYGEGCGETVEVWASARVTHEDTIGSVDVPTPDGWQLLHGEHRCPAHHYPTAAK